MIISISKYKIELSTSQHFMICILIVNIGNYLYNLVLGRWLGPEIFSNVALIVTLLLMLSFLAMTLQLLCAKFIIELPIQKVNSFKILILKYSISFGLLISILFILFGDKINMLFNLNNKFALYIFAIGIPIYFVMSVFRGLFQGEQNFNKLSQSYIMEMLGRVIVTFTLIGFTNISPVVAVALGISISFIMGLFPNEFKIKKINSNIKLSKNDNKLIIQFAVITLLYECTQIIINNSDILIVKHYFNNFDSGLYASLALIGRVVYFITWMLIMLLLPKVIEAKKNGDNPKKVLYKYLKYVIFIITSLVIICFIFPKNIINIFFGNSYVSMSPLLFKYAIATSLFALGNLFVYYFLSLSQYKPVIIAVFFGIAQLLLLITFHRTLEIVVHVQIALMFVFFTTMILWYKRYC